MSIPNPVPNVKSETSSSLCWKSGAAYKRKLATRCSEGRMTHMHVVHETVLHPRTSTTPTPPPSPVAVLAKLPVMTVSALVQIIAGPHHTDSATTNAQMCADVVERRGYSLAEAEAIYHWSLEVEADLGRVGTGEPAETPWSEMLWDYSINLCTLARTAQFISEMAQGLVGKARE